MPARRSPLIRRPNRHSWILEPLEEDPLFVTRPMFGTQAAYYDGKLTLVLADKDEPWRGILVATERDAHEPLVAKFPSLRSHPVLPKWLYLPESAPSFERDAAALVERVRQRDLMIGVLPATPGPAKKRSSRRRQPRS